MANKSRFVIASGKIKSHFHEGKRKIYSKKELVEIFYQNRILWNLPGSMYPDAFIEKLLSSEILIKREIHFEGYITIKERYMVLDTSAFEVALSLMGKSYLSHYTAVYLHGLTKQIPKTIYVSFEQSKKLNTNRKLTQLAIDKAFLKPQRKAATTTIYDRYKIVMHNGMYSNRSGVFSQNELILTNIERTLIDITVRPAYAGGVHSVMEVYRNAIDKISINKLVSILDNLNYIYPYHQAIGFYLEKAGFEMKKLIPLSTKKKEFNFYLTYEMSEKEYDENWKIFHPKGI